MFDSVLRPDQISQGRLGTGMFIAVATHATLLTLAVLFSRQAPTWAIDVEPKWPKVKLRGIPPPAAVLSPGAKATPERNRARRSDLLRPPKDTSQAKPPEVVPQQEQLGGLLGTEKGDPRGGPDGMVGGEPIGGPQPVIGRALHLASPQRIELDDSTVRLTKVSGPDPEYTQQALDREVEGLMLVKCVVTAEGLVRNCRVLRSLPFMDRAVVDALEGRRYKPYISHGNPVDIDYTFRLRLSLPH